MTIKKMSLISNKALMRVAIRMGISGYITLNPDIYEWENGRPEGVSQLCGSGLANCACHVTG
jgi:hypothetical protein